MFDHLWNAIAYPFMGISSQSILHVYVLHRAITAASHVRLYKAFATIPNNLRRAWIINFFLVFPGTNPFLSPFLLGPSAALSLLLILSLLSKSTWQLATL